MVNAGYQLYRIKKHLDKYWMSLDVPLMVFSREGWWLIPWWISRIALLGGDEKSQCGGNEPHGVCPWNSIQFVSLLSSPCPAFCVYEVRERTSSETGSCHHGDLILDAATLRPVTTGCTSEALANVWFLPLSCSQVFVHSGAKVTITAHCC